MESSAENFNYYVEGKRYFKGLFTRNLNLNIEKENQSTK
jgi:hypothetical protein